MTARSSRLFRHDERESSRGGVLTDPLDSLDRFPTQDIGFLLPLPAFQELEKKFSKRCIETCARTEKQ